MDTAHLRLKLTIDVEGRIRSVSLNVLESHIELQSRRKIRDLIELIC